MENKTEKNHADEWLKNLPTLAENPAFKSEEMIHCRRCERTNPPTRLDCLYCGTKLELSEARIESIKLNLRKPENWEKGFNVILLPDSQISENLKLPEIAKILECGKEFLQNLVETEKPLPLVRVESEREAEIVQNRLLKIGVETLIVGDEYLAIEKPARRLRGIEFFSDKLTLILFNQNEVVEISNKDLILIVTGAIFERKIESTEKRVKKGESKILQSTETASDEFLIDIYSREDAIGYRIFAKGFDFSCLAAEKGILATENLKKLVQKLRRTAPDAKFASEYLQARESLGNVWKVEEKTDSQGLKREGFGKFNTGNLTTINNSAQFTKYSRLQRYLL